jgi:hypothetical protein
LFEEKKWQVYLHLDWDTDEAKTTLDDKDVQCRPRNEKSLEDYETWTDCPNENTYFVKKFVRRKKWQVLSHSQIKYKRY